MLKVHAVNRGDQRWRKEHDRGHGYNLYDVVLLDADHAEGGIKQENNLSRKKSGVVNQRIDIPGGGANALPAKLGLVALVGSMVEEREQTSERVGAFACQTSSRPRAQWT
jgi:hypothetical protein